MPSKRAHFVSYKDRHCTDVFCLILFFVFLFIYIFIAVLAIIQGNPNSLIEPSDSLGNLCGQNQFESRPYQLYFDIGKCLTDGVLSFLCPTRKICVEKCPTHYSHYQSLQSMETSRILPRNSTRSQLICVYDYNPQRDNRSIIQIVNAGLCAPYTIASEPFLGRCLPSALTNLFDYEQNQRNVSVKQLNTQIFQIDNFANVGRIILSDLDRIKESFALFILLACLLALIYMFVMRLFTGFMVFLTILLFLTILFLCSAFCWYTIYTGEDLVYEYSTVARIVNDFIKLRTIYYVFGCITTFLFCLSLFVVLTLFNRIRLSIILLEQGARAVFSVLTTFFWSPLIIILFILLTSIIIYIEMCLSTVGKPIFRSIVNNQSIPCLPNFNSTDCVFQQAYGYDALVLNHTDPITRSTIEFLVDSKDYLQWCNLFAYLWFGAFLFALEEMVLAAVFSNYYWSKEQITIPSPLSYSAVLILRFHLGSIAFGSLLIATLRYIRILLDYINRKFSAINGNLVIRFIFKCFGCFLWLFEKFLKFLNKNSYVLIASRGYSFCKATRKAFAFVTGNCLRFLVLVHLTEWILFCGIILVCTCNTYLFYHYLHWMDQYDQLILRWTPMVMMIGISYLISSFFFSVYDMAIKTLFVCFLEDLDENDGSIEHPYAMNNELLRLVQKTNQQVEKKMNATANAHREKE